MSHKSQDIGVASQIGAYSDAVEVKPHLRWLLTSGTPGLSNAGHFPTTYRAKPNSPGNILSRC